MSYLCFRRRSTIGQLNVQTTTAEKEKLCTFSNSGTGKDELRVPIHELRVRIHEL